MTTSVGRMQADERLGPRAVLLGPPIPTARGARAPAASISSSSSSVGSMKRLREERMPRALRDHPHGDAVGGIGAGERVDDIDVALAQQRAADLLARPLEVLLGDLHVDVAPPDPLLRARVRARRTCPSASARCARRCRRRARRPRRAARRRARARARRAARSSGASRRARARRSRAGRARPRRERSRSQRSIVRRTLVRRVTENARHGAVHSIRLARQRAAARTRRGADCGRRSRRRTGAREKYAPIVRVVEQQDVCGYGEPFVPTDIDLLLGEETVALQGPPGTSPTSSRSAPSRTTS